MSGITVFLPTLGRPTGELTMQSFLNQDLIDEDHLYILGSGCRPVWAKEGPHISVIECPLSKYYGHDNVYRNLGFAGGSHWAYIGDDDLYTPGTFRMVREWAGYTDGLLIGDFIIPSGKICYALHGLISIPGKLALGFLQTFIPTWMEIPDFSAFSDIVLMEKLIDTYKIGSIRRMPRPVTVGRFPEMTKEVWDRVELGLGEWRDWRK